MLSTDLGFIAENIRLDGVGQAMPIKELCLEIMRWATRPSLFTPFKERAQALAPLLRSGEEMDDWIREIAQGP